jgi:hypothetical protein
MLRRVSSAEATAKSSPNDTALRKQTVEQPVCVHVHRAAMAGSQRCCSDLPEKAAAKIAFQERAYRRFEVQRELEVILQFDEEDVQVVPYGTEPQQVWSPQGVTILLESCSQFDALWKFELTKVRRCQAFPKPSRRSETRQPTKTPALRQHAGALARWLWRRRGLTLPL